MDPGAVLEGSPSDLCLVEGAQSIAAFTFAFSEDIVRRKLMIDQSSAASQINVVINWFEELKRRAPAKVQ
jgi:hypothetical protein